MLKRQGNNWILYPHKVRYTNIKSEDEEDITKWALEGVEWWEDMDKNHDHITLHEVIDIDVTEDMEERFEEIRDLPEDFPDLYINYVYDGSTGEVKLPSDHPFNIIKLNHTDKKQGQGITDNKLQSMQQGQKQSDMEMRLLELEMEAK